MSASAVKHVRVELPFPLRRWQSTAARRFRRFSVLVVHRRGGKTVLAVKKLVSEALRCHKPDPRYAYVAPFLKQARDVAWGYLKAFARAIPRAEVKEGDGLVMLPNEAGGQSMVRIYGADDPDSLRGPYYDGVVLDEYADMKAEAWEVVLRPALTDRLGWALFIGTPHGIDAFSKLYHAALADPSWYAGCFTVDDTGEIDPDELERARRDMPDAKYRQEFLCDFGASVEDALIPLELAREATQRVYDRASYDFAPVVLGVDVARYGDDRSVIFPRQGLVAFEPGVFQGIDTMTLADHVIAAARKYKADAVFVDEGAMGAGVIDRLRQLRQPCTPVNFGGSPLLELYQNKRAEMWAEMGKWLQDGGRIPNSEPLVADLCALTYTHNSAGRLVLESKEHARERGIPSPDLADALCLTFAAPVNKASAFAGPSGPQRYVPPSQRR